VLVATVLRPEQREDGELEVVRVALEELADTVELLVREAERAMQRFRDLRQSFTVSGEVDGGQAGSSSPKPSRARRLSRARAARMFRRRISSKLT
jgi:hypothetical protein